MNIQQVIESLQYEFRQHGYCVTSNPIPGGEEEYAKELRIGLQKVDAALYHISKRYRGRRTSKRMHDILHQEVPEPIWGVRAKGAK